MIKDALEYLAGLAQGATKLRDVEGYRPDRRIYIAGDGKILDVNLGVRPRSHDVCQLEDLVRIAARFAGEEPFTPVAWYDESAVVLVLDDEGGRTETVTLGLEESDVFAAVKGLAKAAFDHKGFVRLLRVTLAGALPPSALLDVVRRVKFDNGQVTHSEVKKSRESLGREIVSSVSAEGEIPDCVTLKVPVYKTLGESDPYPVRCTVEVDPIEGRFRLTPFPDEIDRVQQLAMGSIAERLASGLPESVPAYYGRP